MVTLRIVVDEMGLTFIEAGFASPRDVTVRPLTIGCIAAKFVGRAEVKGTRGDAIQLSRVS